MSATLNKIVTEVMAEADRAGIVVRKDFVREHVSDMASEIAERLGIGVSSVYANYGDMFQPATIAAQLRLGQAALENAIAGTPNLVLSVENAARVVTHLGGAVRLISYNQSALSGRNKKALFALGQAGDALMVFGSAVEASGGGTVTIKGQAVMNARECLQSAIENLESGIWTYPEENDRLREIVAGAMRADLPLLGQTEGAQE